MNNKLKKRISWFTILIFIFIINLNLVLSSHEICYMGEDDLLSEELISRGYSLIPLDLECQLVLVNQDEMLALKPSSYPNIEKIIYVDAPPKLRCTSKADYSAIKLNDGILEIKKYNISEHITELEAKEFNKKIMGTLGTYNDIVVAYARAEKPITEYYTFDIMQSEQLINALFPKVINSDSAAVFLDTEDKLLQETGKTSSQLLSDEDNKIEETYAASSQFSGSDNNVQEKDKSSILISGDEDKNQDSIKKKIIFALLLGLLLNLPFCMIFFIGASFGKENKSLILNFLSGRALGLVVLGLAFMFLTSYILLYKNLVHFIFGILCIGIGYSTYKKKQFCKKAFGYAGGFAKGVTPCMKFTPILPILIGLSVWQGLSIMLAFIISSTIYFLLIYALIYFLGNKITSKIRPKIIKRITAFVFVLIGLYFISKGMGL